jgi:hypothetical protein
MNEPQMNEIHTEEDVESNLKGISGVIIKMS